MSAIERVLNRLEEKILARSEEVTGQESCRDGAWAVLALPLATGQACLQQPALQG